MRTFDLRLSTPPRRARRMAMLMALALTSVFALVTVFAAPATAATLTVCASGCTYTSIKTAVIAAAANDRIEVGAGTYSETSIVINKPLVIVGAGVGSTIIDGGGGVSAPAGIFRIQTGTPAAGAGPIQISNLTLRNPSRTTAAAPSFGVTLVNSNATTGVSSIAFDSVSILGPNNPAASGYGIYGVGGVTAGVDRAIPSFSFTNGTVNGQTNNGILLEDWKAAVTVTGSELHEGTLAFSQSALLAQSTLSAGRYTAPYTVTGNSFFGSAIWFSGFFSGATPAPRGGFDSITVTDNSMSAMTGNDVGLSLGGTSGPSAPPAGSSAITKLGTVAVRNNTMTGDGLAAANTTGVRVTGAANMADATGNSLTGLRRAVLVQADPSGSPTAVSVTGNRIFADTTGLDNTSATAVDATGNWWGCQNGPVAGAASGYCSLLSNTGTGTVDTTTWIMTTAALATSTPTVGSSTALTTNLITLNTGATVPAPAVFAGLPVTRAADTGSVSPASGSLTDGIADAASYLAPTDVGCGSLAVTVDRQVFASRTVTGEPVNLPFCVAAPPVITSTAPTSGTTGVAYTFPVTATGTGPISYAVTAGALPDGLTLDANTGIISGTPTLAGSFDFTITATNAAGTDNAAYTQVVAAPPVITSTAPTSGTTGVAYTFPVTATGTGPISYAVTAGGLPDGLTLDANTGIISGTPTLAGSFDFTITATNAAGTDSADYNQIVSAPPVITSAAPTSGTTGVAYTFPVTATGTGPISYTVTAGALPDGLTLDVNTGIISGTPTVAGSFDFTITATNAAGSDSAAYTEVVTAAVVPTPPPTTPTAPTPTSNTTPLSGPDSIAATGAHTTAPIGLAGTALLAGLVLLIVARMRRARANRRA